MKAIHAQIFKHLEKNLPNRQKIGKTKVFGVVRLSYMAERRKTDKTGARSPFWGQETRFLIPPGYGSRINESKIHGFHDSRDPVLICNAAIDLKSIYKDGEFDKWVELLYNFQYVGEVYLEMTYYSEAPPPVLMVYIFIVHRDH